MTWHGYMVEDMHSFLLIVYTLEYYFVLVQLAS